MNNYPLSIAPEDFDRWILQGLVDDGYITPDDLHDISLMDYGIEVNEDGNYEIDVFWVEDDYSKLIESLRIE